MTEYVLRFWDYSSDGCSSDLINPRDLFLRWMSMPLERYGPPRSSFGIRPSTHPAARSGRAGLWFVDHRGARAPWLQVESGHALSDAPCDGEEGLSRQSRGATRQRPPALLSRHRSRLRGVRPCAGKGTRVVRRTGRGA